MIFRDQPLEYKLAGAEMPTRIPPWKDADPGLAEVENEKERLAGLKAQ